MLMTVWLPVGALRDDNAMHAPFGIQAASAEAKQPVAAAKGQWPMKIIWTIIEIVRDVLVPGREIEIGDEQIPLSGPDMDGGETLEQAEAPEQGEAPAQPQLVETAETPVAEVATAVPQPATAVPTAAPVPTAQTQPEQEAPVAVEPESFTVSYEDENGVLIKRVTIVEGEKAEKPREAPQKEGYTFLYWHDIMAGTAQYVFDTPVHKDLRLRPVYEMDITETPDNTAGNEVPEPDNDEETLPDVNDIPFPDDETPGPDEMIDVGAEAEPEPTEIDPPDTDSLQTDPGTDEVAGIPSVEILFSFQTENDDGLLVEGDAITVTAVLSGFPENATLQYQWQNNASGAYMDVPGATDISYTFTANAQNTGCSWQVVITVLEAEESLN